MNQNILLQKDFNTPEGTFPFDRISLEDIRQAIYEGIALEDQEISAITDNPEAPTFANTIAPHTGRVLERATTLMYNQLSACTSDELESLAQEVSPHLSEHASNIMLNARLFGRVKAVWDDIEAGKVTLDAESYTLTKDLYDSFVRSGALLDEEKKARLREISKKLSLLGLQFSQNNIKAQNDFVLHITDKSQLAGIPETGIEQAEQAAKEKNLDGWAFTLHAPSYIQFMKYAENRDLRQKMYMAYGSQSLEGEFSNTEICREIVNLRLEKAQLLGFETYADYVLQRRMASSSAEVYDLLNQLIEVYYPAAEKELESLTQFAQSLEGEDFVLQPWDTSHYAHLQKLDKYNIDAEMLRPYFPLDSVIKGVFGLATRLYGITFEKAEDISAYHDDVRTFRVKDSDGRFLAVLYADFYTRDNKKSGAWMTNYKEQWHEENGTDSRPHISITTNFSKPTATRPTLLTHDELTTFLHEFGHALHGIFADTRYAQTSGTNVYWDFVELPSQIMENYAYEQEFLSAFAVHYQTGEVLPQALIDRIRRSQQYGAAMACMRQVTFGLLDMAYYARKERLPEDIVLQDFEKEAWRPAQVQPSVPGTCMTVHFGHIMSGGYAAGYYSYKWAEVLDADAFAYFKENGIFNPDIARAFRDKVLSRGGTRHPMELYIDFRGRRPSIDALLHRDGVLNR